MGPAPVLVLSIGVAQASGAPISKSGQAGIDGGVDDGAPIADRGRAGASLSARTWTPIYWFRFSTLIERRYRILKNNAIKRVRREVGMDEAFGVDGVAGVFFGLPRHSGIDHFPREMIKINRWEENPDSPRETPKGHVRRGKPRGTW